MKIIDSIKKDNLHHAYALEGDVKNILEELNGFIEKTFNIDVRNYSDYRRLSFDVLGIEEARALRDAQIKKSLTGNKKFFVIHAGSMTLEAQNALLKIFEEPTPDTHFFLILNSFEKLLPTLKSRLLLISVIGDKDRTVKSKIGRDFLKQEIGERFKMSEAISESKDKLQVTLLLDALESYFSDDFKNGDFNSKEVIQEIYRVRKYLDDRSSSIKLLLEHLSATLPVIEN